MPERPQVLADLETEVARDTDIKNSAAILINGIKARIQAAVDQAIAGGATPEQLAPVQAEVDALKASSDSLATAVAANT